MIRCCLRLPFTVYDLHDFNDFNGFNELTNSLINQLPRPYALCPMRTSRKDNITLLLLILLGVIIVPVLFIWRAENLFALTVKTFLAAFFLLLLIRTVPRKGRETGPREPPETDL